MSSDKSTINVSSLRPSLRISICRTSKMTQVESPTNLSVSENSIVLLCERDISDTYYFMNEDQTIIQCIKNCKRI